MVLNESQMSNWLFPSNALIGKWVPYRQRLQKDKYPISSLIAVFGTISFGNLTVWYCFILIRIDFIPDYSGVFNVSINIKKII